MEEVKRLKVLVDCDGVLADFLLAVLTWVHERTGKKYYPFNVTEYDVLASIGEEHLKEIMQEHAGKGGWCSSFKPIAGARRALDMLRLEHDVVCVTTQMSTPCWAFEREKWLQEQMGFKKDDIIFTKGKHHVPGDIFLDDSGENCIKWHEEHPNAITVVWDTPYNQDAAPSCPARNFRRVKNWHDFIAMVGHKADNPHF